jgi:cystathionine beta-lyase
MDRHCYNAKKVVEFLKGHKKVDKIYYPGIESHPNQRIAKKQMRDFGGMISFTLKNDTTEAAHSTLKKTRLFSLAESLGGVESLIGHPATMTHASIPREVRIQAGVVDSLIRLSVGIEEVSDLIADLETALD